MTASNDSDPINFLESLDPNKLEARLRALQDEAKAVRVLLRSVRARQQAKARKAAVSGRGGPKHG
jgi:hypothetical protein